MATFSDYFKEARVDRAAKSEADFYAAKDFGDRYGRETDNGDDEKIDELLKQAEHNLESIETANKWERDEPILRDIIKSAIEYGRNSK